MKFLKTKTLAFLMILFGSSCADPNPETHPINYDDLMIRVAEIEIDPAFRDEYIAILKEEAEASVRREPGVICIYPMFEKERPTAIRLLEIYENKAAYEAHLQTPHFQHYKTTTLEMVKSLKLIEMEAIDEETMPRIFEKLNR